LLFSRKSVNFSYVASLPSTLDLGAAARSSMDLLARPAKAVGRIAAEDRPPARADRGAGKKRNFHIEFLRSLEEQIDLNHRLVANCKNRRVTNVRKPKVRKTPAAHPGRAGAAQTNRGAAGGDVLQVWPAARHRILLTARSFNQMLLWAKYQQQLADNDRRILAGITEKRQQIGQQKSLLDAELQAHQRALSEKQKEEETLKNRRAQRQEVLKKARKDKNFYQTQLAETQRAIGRIKQLISSAEAKAPRRVSDGSVDYSKYDRLLRKSMPWPVEGRIVSHYGSYRHPVLNTITTNLGIDIIPQGGVGAPVRSIASGRVTAITWQRGYGNLVIISHADGYYSVYTHLADINVALNEEVATAQTIGTLGDSGSLQGPTLHFQVWKREEALNPEEWLRP
jgi:murein DD-endopeptidase MepM/ murein hydrolase activator NlpD